MSLNLGNYLNGLYSYYGQAPAVGQPAVIGGLANANMLGSLANVAMVGGNGYGNPSVHVIATTSETIHEIRDNQREDEEKSRENLAAVVGGIATVVIAGISAFVGRNLCNTLKELESAVKFRDNDLPKLEERVRNELPREGEDHHGGSFLSGSACNQD